MAISIACYCDNTTTGNAQCVSVGTLDLYFSYKTIVAYRDGFNAPVVRENDWGPTTGKHLNAIDNGNKTSRLPGDQFETQLNAVLSAHNL